MRKCCQSNENSATGNSAIKQPEIIKHPVSMLVSGQKKVTDLRQLLRDTVQTCPDKVAYIEMPDDPNAPVSFTYKELEARINALGTALSAPYFQEKVEDCNLPGLEGMNKPRLAILGDNSVDWIVAQNAAMFGAGLAVPLDKQLGLKELQGLLSRARCRKIFLDASKKTLIDGILAQPGSITDLILIGGKQIKVATDLASQFRKDTSATNLATDVATNLALDKPEAAIISPICTVNGVRVWRLNDLEVAGQTMLLAGQDAFLKVEIDPKAPAAIFFTSGTTSKAKGVVLSHSNISHVEYICRASIKLPYDKMVLSVLPLHHTLENSAQYAWWGHRQTIVFNNGLRYISQNLQKFPIELMVTVPLLLDNIKRQVEHALAKRGKQKQFALLCKLSHFALKLGIDLRPRLFQKVREAISPNLKLFIVGAAALTPETEAFFAEIGFSVYVGYGLTETAPILAMNSNFLQVAGSVGTFAAGVEAKFLRDGQAESTSQNQGEVLVRCPNLMLGYYEDKAATQAAIDRDGWFHTGDVGYLDEHGALFITGRVKSMIVLTNGKKIFPEELEALIALPEIVDQAMAFGGHNKRDTIDVCLLLHLNEAVKAKLKPGEELPYTIKEQIQQELARINAQVPPYKAIKYWAWTIDSFVMTSTLKIKREPTLTKLLNGLTGEDNLWRELNGKEVKLK